jgi:hypothetical protein
MAIRSNVYCRTGLLSKLRPFENLQLNELTRLETTVLQTDDDVVTRLPKAKRCS